MWIDCSIHLSEDLGGRSETSQET